MEVMLLVVTLLVILIIFLRKKRKVSIPPGPPGLPFLGNLHQLDSSAPHKYLGLLSKKYGPLMSMKLGSKPTLVVSSSRMAEEVMKNQDLIFCSRPALLGQQKLSYYGLDIALAPYNEYWREMKKICVLHLLSSKRVQSFRPIREDEVSRMIKKISQGASLSEIINLSDTIMSLTNTITCRVAFGKRYDEEDQERRSFFALIEEAEAAMVNFYVSDYFPLIGWLDKLTGAIARLDNIFHRMDSVYQEFIDNHLDTNRPKSMDDDIIDILLYLREDKSTGIDLTMDHIKAVLMNVFLAGTETSAATIVWTMTALIKSPTAMKKVQAEIRKLMGNKDMVDEDDCQKLPYLKAVVKETLRLYPPAPLLVPRETMERCILDGYEIQPKTMVYVNAWAIGRDPEYWEKPEEFLPERFLNSDIDFKGRDFGLIPFGSGRRRCPGISMALPTVELVLANILNLFDWSVPPGMEKEDIDTDSLPGITVQKKNALSLQNVFLGGTETRDAAIVWEMTALIKCPTAMKKVQAEIRKLMGNKDMVDEDDCQKLPYLKEVVKEAFGLYPPIPLLLPRETMERCIIDGYDIQPKTMVYVNVWAIARNPEVWEKPDEF